jgi:hypothetical protein
MTTTEHRTTPTSAITRTGYNLRNVKKAAANKRMNKGNENAQKGDKNSERKASQPSRLGPS